jgi:hypothetical protein
MITLPDVLNLPLDTIAVLAAGYLGYRLAYIGKDAGHSSVDVVFLSLVYALSAKLVLQTAPLLPQIPLPAVLLLAIAAAMLVAAIWRKWGEHRVAKALHHLGVSQSDRHNSAWDSILANDNLGLTTLVVRKTDGSSVRSWPLADFAKERLGPCILGQDGSVALFVTHFRTASDPTWIDDDPRTGQSGVAMTFIPATQISEIEFNSF